LTHPAEWSSTVANCPPAELVLPLTLVSPCLPKQSPHPRRKVEREIFPVFSVFSRPWHLVISEHWRVVHELPFLRFWYIICIDGIALCYQTASLYSGGGNTNFLSWRRRKRLVYLSTIGKPLKSG